MDDLAAFLAARLDEDEAGARELITHNACARAGGLRSTLWDEQDQDAQRQLREVEAKRAILAAHTPYVSYPDTDDPDGEPLVYELCAVCVTDKDGYAENWVMDQWPCLPVRALAAVWSDHPDFQPEWATAQPEGDPS